MKFTVKVIIENYFSSLKTKFLFMDWLLNYDADGLQSIRNVFNSFKNCAKTSPISANVVFLSNVVNFYYLLTERAIFGNGRHFGLNFINVWLRLAFYIRKCSNSINTTSLK